MFVPQQTYTHTKLIQNPTTVTLFRSYCSLAATAESEWKHTAQPESPEGSLSFRLPAPSPAGFDESKRSVDTSCGDTMWLFDPKRCPGISKHADI